MSQQAQEVYRHYIGGEWVEGDGTETFESENPATGETLGTFQRATEADVDDALAAARDAQAEWRDLSYIDRAEYLWDIYHELRDRHDELGRVVTKECGKEISEGKADVTEAWHMVEWAAGNARHPHGDVVPSEIPSKDSYMRRKPRGVVGCITPWNFPVAIPFWHMAVSLVEGNTVVWKPAEQTPWCGQIIAEMFEDAGVPDGVFNMVQGFGDAGNAIVEDERVDTVLFTGSSEVGHKIAGTVGGEPGKLAACEMGGKNGVVVTDEADLDVAVHSAVMSSFKTTGQRCVSSERLVVHEDGAATAATGERSGSYANGHWVGPFVYEIDYDPELRCLKEEVFGPHVALVEYSGDVDRAIEVHNDTPYGLAGAIISEDYRQINQFRDHAELGLAYANLPCIGAEVQLPFGGVKKSGNGYPSAREVIEAVTERTAWTLNNSTDIEMAQGLSADIKTQDD